MQMLGPREDYCHHPPGEEVSLELNGAEGHGQSAVWRKASAEGKEATPSSVLSDVCHPSESPDTKHRDLTTSGVRKTMDDKNK